MSAEITIAPERADHPEAVGMLDFLDRYLASLYAPEENHILGVDALLKPEVSFLVARMNGRPIGCGAARRVPAEPQCGLPAYGEIKRMYVAPAARGQRVAARLLEALEIALRTGGITVATLETGRDQSEAIRLYERSGYTLRGPFGGYPDNGLSLFYEKRLQP